MQGTCTMYVQGLISGWFFEIRRGNQTRSSILILFSCIPYSLDQTPRLLFISSSEFVRRLFESGDYSRAAFINTSSCQRDNPLRNGRLIPLI